MSKKKIVIIVEHCQLCPHKIWLEGKHALIASLPFCGADGTPLPYKEELTNINRTIAAMDPGIKEGCPLEDDV